MYNVPFATRSRTVAIHWAPQCGWSGENLKIEVQEGNTFKLWGHEFRLVLTVDDKGNRLDIVSDMHGIVDYVRPAFHRDPVHQALQTLFTYFDKHCINDASCWSRDI